VVEIFIIEKHTDENTINKPLIVKEKVISYNATT